MIDELIFVLALLALIPAGCWLDELMERISP
jgi:hypothetical protein